jgi:hypothetical protein
MQFHRLHMVSGSLKMELYEHTIAGSSEICSQHMCLFCNFVVLPYLALKQM